MANEAPPLLIRKSLVDDEALEKVALRFQEAPCTYGQLESRIASFANQFRERFADGEVVALWLPNGPEILCACLAGIRCSVVPMPVSPEAKLPELVKILRRSQCRHLVTSEGHAERLAGEALQDTMLQCIWSIAENRLAPLFRLERGPESSRGGADGWRAAPDTALILHTSGSSGQPKGVMISTSSLQHIIRGRMESASITQESTAVVASSLSHSVGLYQALAFLAAGASFELLEWYDIPAMAERINRMKPSHLILVVAAFEKLLRCPSIRAESFERIRFAAVGADRVPKHLQEAYFALTGQPLCVTYGMTELSWMLVNRSENPAKCTALGQPAPGVEIRLLDEDGKEVGNGGLGQIVARSPKAMLGYLHDPGETRERIRDGWIMTGDLASRDDDGDYWYAGRINDLIALASGDLVAPLEVEREILDVPGVRQCVVLGMPSPRLAGEGGSEEPWAIVMRVDPGVTREHILAQLEPNLSDYKMPRRIVFLDQLPEGASGKISRRALRQWLLNRTVTE